MAQADDEEDDAGFGSHGFVGGAGAAVCRPQLLLVRPLVGSGYRP